MEANEALIVGVLGLASLYTWTRRRDTADKWLALATLWICGTGSIGLLLAQLDDAAYSHMVRYPATLVRLALRLSGPPMLLILCEETVRTKAHPGSRKTSIGFAAVIWVAAVGALIWTDGGSLGELQLRWFNNVSFGVTSWMAILAVSFLAALLTIVPAGLRRINPGFAGIAALILLTSEFMAAINPQWGSGAFEVGAVLSYRSLLTFALAAAAIIKAHSEGWKWMMSASWSDPLSGSSPEPTRSPEPKRSARRAAKKGSRASKQARGSSSAPEKADKKAAADEAGEKKKKKASPRTSSPGGKKSGKKKKGKKKKGKR